MSFRDAIVFLNISVSLPTKIETHMSHTIRTVTAMIVVQY
jgi:hypothetical protein